MKIAVLRNELGVLTGILIPVEELNELWSSLMADSEFLKELELILGSQKVPFDKSLSSDEQKSL